MARGDQIYVYREFLNLEGVYEHHGIDCGDGTVVHAGLVLRSMRVWYEINAGLMSDQRGFDERSI